jgi:hypothetical protein
MNRLPGHHSPHRRMTGVIRSTISRLAELEGNVRDLRQRVAKANYRRSNFRESLDMALHELDSNRKALSDLSLNVGVTTKSGASAPKAAPGARNCLTAMSPSAAAARLLAGCDALSKRLCSMLRIARAIKDQVSEGIACALLRTLERLLWLFLPHANVVEPQDLYQISGMSQLRLSAL